MSEACIGERDGRSKPVESRTMAGPSVTTIKRLFAVASNRCAFPGCTIPLVEPATREILAEICHIKGVRGPRHDPSITEDELHAFDNLILLCGVHHKIIDGVKSQFTVPQLVAMKAAHEASATPVAEPTDAVVTQILAQHAAIHAELAASARASLEILQQQIRDQRMERAGPVIAFIDDELRTVRRWLIWCEDSSFLAPILGAQPPVLLSSAETALQQSTRVSPEAYQNLSAAVERIRIFDGIIAEVRDWHRKDSSLYQWKDNTELYLSSIRNARDFLVETEQLLVQARQQLMS